MTTLCFALNPIKQRYPGHARNVLHVAANCQGGAYAGKWTVVVDDDIDASSLDDVLWAMSACFSHIGHRPHPEGLSLEARTALLPGNFHNNHRLLVDACVPYDLKIASKFPPVVDMNKDLTREDQGPVHGNPGFKGWWADERGSRWCRQNLLNISNGDA